MLVISVIILCLSLSVSVLYKFVVRPIQQDKKLDKCLDGMWKLYGNQDVVYAQKSSVCVNEIKD